MRVVVRSTVAVVVHGGIVRMHPSPREGHGARENKGTDTVNNKRFNYVGVSVCREKVLERGAD